MEYKFVFNKSKNAVTAARRGPREVATSISALEHEQEKNQRKKQRKEELEKSRRSREDIDAPFAILTGDKSNYESPSFQFAHKSIDEYKGLKNDLPYARTLKLLLRSPGSGYKKILLPPSHYEQHLSDEHIDLVRKAHYARGGTGAPMLEAYIPDVDSKPSEEYLKFMQSIEQAKLRANKGRSAISSGSQPRQLEPGDPVNLAATHGLGSIAHMLSFSTAAPFKSGTGLCKCGEEASKHVTVEEAIKHFKKTKEHLEIHNFIPQGSADATSDAILSQSPLLKITRPVEQPDGSMKMQSGVKAFDDESGVKGNWLPMVRLGLEPTSFRRLIGFDKARQGVAAVANRTKKLVEKTTQPCTCTDGEIVPGKLSGAANCPDCATPGKITYKTSRDASGKLTLRPYTRAVGDGLLQFVNEQDAPSCKGGCVGGRVYNDKTSTTGAICSKCNGTGKDLTSFKCTNHNNPGSAIQLTANNKHARCNGTGLIEKITSSLVSRKPKTINIEDTNLFEGNGRFAMPFAPDPGRNIQGILWKGHANPRCTRCNGDDEYQTENGLPCNCRIASPTDENVLPGNVRVVDRRGINLPEHHYGNHMLEAYGNDMANAPHEIGHMPNNIVPGTGDTVHQTYRIGSTQQYSPGSDTFDDASFLGLWSPGKRIPKADHEHLLRKSREHASSVNAPFCAASADLEEANNLLSNRFKVYPDNIMTSTLNKAKRYFTRATRRVSPELYPQKIQPAIANVESTISALPDSHTGRYNRLADQLYTHAGLLAGSDSPTTDRSWNKFQKNKERMLNVVNRFHGEGARNDVADAIDKLLYVSKMDRLFSVHDPVSQETRHYFIERGAMIGND